MNNWYDLHCNILRSRVRQLQAYDAHLLRQRRCTRLQATPRTTLLRLSMRSLSSRKIKPITKGHKRKVCAFYYGLNHYTTPMKQEVISMSHFETIGVERQYNAINANEAKRAFSNSCTKCCTRGKQINCDRCHIAFAHELAIFCFERNGK